MSKTLKKTLSIIIAILMIVSTVPVAFAAETGSSGYCGASTNDGGAESVTWTLDSDGVLTISGTGAMADYYYSTSPFYNNSDITTVVIKNGVTSIGNFAFLDCLSLASVTISDSVTSIGNYAFRVCTSLTSITIPDSVTSIGNYTFFHCTSLENITVDEDNEYYSSENGVLFNKDKTTLIQYPLGNTETLYTIPDGVTSIGMAAFEYCTSLASVTIPDSVTSIGGYAFYYCPSLANIEIPDSVTSIGDYAIQGCSVLDNITVDEDNEYYSSENGVLFNKDKTTLIQYPAGNSRISYTIPDGVTSIGKYTFYGCSSLESIEIPDSVTSIGVQAFYGCESLESIEIPDSVTSIGEGAFMYCTSLASVTIGKSVTNIDDYAFGWCDSLESIEIPDSVTSIVDWAFYNCTSLTLVHYLGTSEQWDGIEIGSYGNDELTGATRHYCTETESVDATCTEAGYTAGWYCADCEEYVVGGEETTALGHVDADGDYVCDNGCGHEFEKPVDPTPDTPDEPTDNVCEDCGKVHTNFFSEIICFFTRIINYIKNLFA